MSNYTQTLELLQKSYCRLAPTQHGVGVVAIRDIPEGTPLFVGQLPKDWVKIPVSEIKKLPESVQTMIDDFFVVDGDEVAMPRRGLASMDMSFYINHSDQPNAETIDGGFTFVSTREIKAGEEVTTDYGVYDESWKK